MSNEEKFAVDVVKRLQAAQFEAFWAGGCVRDRLLHRPPKDYDVASNATPAQVRELFGRKRTIAIGEAFGVIAVLGPKNAFQVEVATFRKDAEYSDGRRPDSVDFCGAEEDAKRRDFTVNGLFFNPITAETIDYVGGQADLQQKTLRAIGKPEDRFAEDKLRILRAVRFATELDFEIEPLTLAAVSANPAQILSVSAERITEEMRKLLRSVHRWRGIRLLLETGLLPILLPECGWNSTEASTQEAFLSSENILKRIHKTTFAAGMAALLRHLPNKEKKTTVSRVCRRWKMANADEQLIGGMLEFETTIRHAHLQPWSVVQPILIRKDAAELVEFADSVSQAMNNSDAKAIEFCRRKLDLANSELNPKPLLTGDDLATDGLPPGAIYRKILTQVRAAQLDETIRTVAEAKALATSIVRNEGIGD